MRYLAILLIAGALAGCAAPKDTTAPVSTSTDSLKDAVTDSTKSFATPDSTVVLESSSIPESSAIPDSSAIPEDPADAVDLTKMVSGIRNISTYEGMSPDPISGITWDENYVDSVTVDDSGVDWNKEGTYRITYHIEGKGKAEKEIEVKIRKNLEDYLFGMEGRAKILSSEAEAYDGLEDVFYDEEEMEITADTSRMRQEPGDYIIVYNLKGKDGHVQNLNRIVSVVETIESEVPGNLYVDDGTYTTMTDLGIWRLTAYMDTPADQGPYVGQTASGSPLVAGHTVAVSAATCQRHGLSFGDKLMVNGHIYTLEDHGGSAMYDQDWIDIFVDNEADEYSEEFNQYSHVYLLK